MVAACLFQHEAQIIPIIWADETKKVFAGELRRLPTGECTGCARGKDDPAVLVHLHKHIGGRKRERDETVPLGLELVDILRI